MSDEKPYYHVAPIQGVSTVFCNLEFPRDRPPEFFIVDGHRYVREVQPSNTSESSPRR